MDNFKEAVKYCTESLNIKKDAKTFNVRGDAYLRLKQYDSAIQDYTNAIILDNTDSYYYRTRAMAYKNVGKFELALEDISKACDLAST